MEKLCPAIIENFIWQESITLLVNRLSDELLCAAHVALLQLWGGMNTWAVLEVMCRQNATGVTVFASNMENVLPVLKWRAL